jgi:hypothetical protein
MSEKTPVPEKGVDKTWYLCSDSEETKNKLMNLVIKLRLKKQHNAGLWFKKNLPPKKETMSEILSPKIPTLGETVQVENMLNGYWIMLQDWSSCSKKCGGGESYQHLMCVPPKNGGKPCEGEALRSKPCNPQPCPSINEAAAVLPSQGREKVNKAIVKMMPISSRPLRYDKCHLKESDALFTKFKPGVGITENPMKIPARVVMNEKSVTIFTDETLATEIGTFIIEKTSLKLLTEKPNCFYLESETIKGEFCNLDASSKVSFTDEWNYDFNLFKIQCHTERDVIKLNQKEEQELQNELDKKIDSAKLDVLSERTKRIKQRAAETPINKIEKLQETTMMAMNKELKIDELLQREEVEREQAEERELKLKLELEKKKDECLIKSIKEKELDDQFNLSKQQQEKEANNLKEEAKQQILNKRKQVKMKIMQMRKRSLRKRMLLNQQIQVLRSQVANQLNTVSKEGNMDLCFKPTASQDDKKKMMKYCKVNFADASPVKFNECLAEASFCYVCCETEFGDMHVKKRDTCYDKCDEEPKKKDSAGSWQWVEPVA